MLSWLPAVLVAMLAGCLVLAPVLYLAHRRAAACGATGLALAAVAAASVLAMAENPDPGTNATGLLVLAAVVALAGFALAAVRRPLLQRPAFASGYLACMLLAAALVYLLVGFKIF